MSWDNADAESVGAAFRCGYCSLIKITAVAVAPAWIQNTDRRIFDSAIVGFAMIRFNADVVWIDIAQVDVRADLE